MSKATEELMDKCFDLEQTVRELEEKITEAKSETKEEILTYLRDCADDLGCPLSESNVLYKAADNIEKHIDIGG